MLGDDARPDDVDLIDVVVGRLGAELLVVDGQAVGRALFTRDEFSLDPGGFGELAIAASSQGRSGLAEDVRTARTRAPARSVRSPSGTTIDHPGSCPAGVASCAIALRVWAEMIMPMTGALSPSAMPRRMISRREIWPVRLSATRRPSGLELESYWALASSSE